MQIDINSVRHWIAYVMTRNPDHGDFDNKELRKSLDAKQVDQIFAPLKFLGWQRHRPTAKGSEAIVSRAKKDASNTFVFDLEPARISWGLEQLRKHLGERGADSMPGVFSRSVADRKRKEQATDADRAVAAEVFAKLPTAAKELELRGTKLSIDGGKSIKIPTLKVIPPSLGRLIKLEDLVIADAPIVELPRELGKLCALTRLSVEHTRIPTLPDQLGELTKLAQLELEWNEMLVSVPASLGDCTKLELLSVDHCTALAHLPAQIGELVELASLSISSTKITELPSLAKLARLDRFNCYYTVFDVRARDGSKIPPQLLTVAIDLAHAKLGSVSPALEHKIRAIDAGVRVNQLIAALLSATTAAQAAAAVGEL